VKRVKRVRTSSSHSTLNDLPSSFTAVITSSFISVSCPCLPYPFRINSSTRFSIRKSKTQAPTLLVHPLRTRLDMTSTAATTTNMEVSSGEARRR
jgi:hypothetical protein